MFQLEPGNYVVAVSGGVDSVVLLHMLTLLPELRLTVAHFDHGIRKDSAEDRKHVQKMAAAYGLELMYAEGKLGEAASEATARKARYGFLHEVRASTGSVAIITAHHQDDLLETAILNMLRGTGRRGLSSLKSTDTIKRPLLHMSKTEIKKYAHQNKLQWREDSTNADTKYLRNYLRMRILPRFSKEDKLTLVDIVHTSLRLNESITSELTNYLHMQPHTHVLDRHWFIMLPHEVARDVMAEWLLLRIDVELSKKLIEQLTVTAKTGQLGTKQNVGADYWLRIGPDNLALTARER